MDNDTAYQIQLFHQDTGIAVLGGHKKEYAKYIVYTIFLRDSGDDILDRIKSAYHPLNPPVEFGRFKYGAKGIVKIYVKK